MGLEDVEFSMSYISTRSIATTSFDEEHKTKNHNGLNDAQKKFIIHTFICTQIINTKSNIKKIIY